MKRVLGISFLVLTTLRVIVATISPASTFEQAQYNFSGIADNNLYSWLYSIINYSGKSLLIPRLIHLAITVLSQILIFLFLAKIIRNKRKYLSWLVIVSTISFTFISSFNVRDSYLIFFWTISIISFYTAVFQNNNTMWIIAGVSSGLAILCKLSGLALPTGIVLFLIFSSRYRYHIYRPFSYLYLIITFLVALPVLTVQSSLIHKQWQPVLMQNLFDYFNLTVNPGSGFVVSQIVFIFPILYIGLWWVTGKYFVRIFDKPNQVNPEMWFLLSFFLPLFLGFHLISIFSLVDFTGLIPVYLTGLIILLKLIKRRWIFWSLGLSVFAHLVLFIILLHK